MKELETSRRQTTFDKLTALFDKNRNGGTVDGYTQQTFGVDREVFRTKSKEEYESKLKEKQQSKFLNTLWTKANALIQHQILQNEARRIPSYYDYEKMDEYPLIGSALDIFMEECTTVNEKGNVLNIYSNSPRVQKELETLFYTRLNINSNSPMWTRNTCKYGDNFVFFDVDPEKGIIDCKQLPNIEIERIDGGLLSYLMDNEKKDTIFRWKTSRSVEFKQWQVAHFRLLTDDRKLPYGVSVLEKARRTWRNLLLVEDAMRTIRLLRASDRRVFYIGIGNIEDQNDVKAYVNSIADRYKRKRAVDPETGQEDIKYNVMGIDQDYFIPVRGADDGSKVDTLPGQTNLDIADIEYDLKLLATALRVPKTYLNFEEAQGDGKNLSMQDMRFARTVNRIQQSMLQEYNKIAIVHLIAVGLEDETGNFVLTLNNPSIQTDLLKTELLQTKISLYKDATEPTTTGIAPMSHTKAKKEILGFTDAEVKDDLIQQRFERALGAELMKTEQIINRTGYFDEVDKMYGVKGAGYSANSDGTPSSASGGGGGGGGGGLSDLGGETSPEAGPEAMPPEGNVGGELGAPTPEAPGGPETPALETAAPEETPKP